MNKCILVGRLTRDPEVRYTQAQKIVCTFTLAVDRRVAAGQEKEADFIQVVVWRKVAEACGNSLSKGSKALVDGRLQIRNYTDDSGVKHWATEVIAQSVEFLDRRNAGNTGNSGGADDPNQFGDDVPL